MSRASAAVARRFRVTLWPLRWSACICNCRHPRTADRHYFSTVLRWRPLMHVRGAGAHDGLYAARVYRQDRRRLLRRLRQSSGCSPIRSCRISGFGGITGPRRRSWPDGRRAGVGSSPESEQSPHAGLHPARVYRHDCRRLLRRLRQSSRCRPVRSCRISGFGGITRPCRRAWPNGSPGVDTTSSCPC